MNDPLTTQVHLAQAGLSAYGLFHAVKAIRNLQQWEPTTEKAAKYSKTAEHELHKTRTTQTSAALAIFCSMTTALYIAVQYPETAYLGLVINLFNVTFCMFARQHITGFWQDKTKVPGVTTYNDAINSTLVMKRQLGWLALFWAVSSFMEGKKIFG